jgi:hypothetical protein
MLPTTKLVGVAEAVSTVEPESASTPMSTIRKLQRLPKFIKITHAL